ncbi:hypothetical protein SCWH03_27910 [Streptomyces pacificus]|uniref:Uncharacterized protein n=1 Tax=Streptomyces pacificus TaxID=2705029 RepID=A0A6A0AUH5_9ACTN|nr:hypothetical protein SCWH03_27910 [Streptomyces pacificus]
MNPALTDYLVPVHAGIGSTDAVSNAVFHPTGRRTREPPLVPEQLLDTEMMRELTGMARHSDHRKAARERLTYAQASRSSKWSRRPSRS